MFNKETNKIAKQTGIYIKNNVKWQTESSKKRHGDLTKGRAYWGCFTPSYSFGSPLKNDNGKVQKAQFFRLFEAMDGKILTYKEMKKYISTAVNLQTICYSKAVVKVGRGRYTLSISGHKYVKEVNKLIK